MGYTMLQYANITRHVGIVLLVSVSSGADLGLRHSSASHIPARYVVEVDGSVLEPPVYSLDGSRRTPQPGDVVEIGLLLTLGSPKAYRFRTTTPENGSWRVMLEAEDGSTRVVGVGTWCTRTQNDEPLPLDPLAGLSEEEIRGLWGVELLGWTEATIEKLKFLDLNHTCLTVDLSTEYRPQGAAMRLPASLRYLSLEARGRRPDDSNPLAGLTSLSYLKVSGFHPFDASWLAGCNSLQYLDLRFTRITNFQRLSSLTGLRCLNLVLCHSLILG